MKSISLALFFSLLLASCGHDSSSKHQPSPEPSRVPDATACTSDCGQPSTDGSSGSGDANGPTKGDTDPPRVIGFKQIGLTQLAFEFSEPIKKSSLYYDSQSFQAPQWSEDRKTLIAIFTLNQTAPQLKTFIINSLTDDAGNTNSQRVEIPIDNAAPRIQAVKRIDNSTLELVFDEDVVLNESSQITINQTVIAKADQLTSNDKKLTVHADGEGSASLTAGLVAVTNLADTYGNIASRRTGRFFSSDDSTAPTITAIRQLPTEKRGMVPYAVFDLEFSEYALDSRDQDTSGGALGDLENILNGLGTFELNGVKTYFFEGVWEARADHRGGILKWPVVGDMKHNQKNTIGFNLIDIAGNKTLSAIEFIADLRAPTVTGSYSKQDQCFMNGLQAFRCKISASDVASATLGNLEDWPQDSYTTSVSEEGSGDAKQAWLNFTFKQDVPENVIWDIEIKDRFGNSNKDWANTVLFIPQSKAPEVLNVTAFGSHVLELRMRGSIGKIDSILVDNVRREFTLVSGDELHSYIGYIDVSIAFAEEIPEGSHSIVLNGVERLRNAAARTDKIELMAKDNNAADIILSTIHQENPISGNDLEFELTRPLNGQKIAIFAETTSNGETVRTELNDFDKVEGAVTTKGTYPIRLIKKSATGLRPDSLVQLIVLQIADRPETPVNRLRWSTKAPSFSVYNGDATSQSFAVYADRDVDTGSVRLEVVDTQGTVLKIDSSWITTSPDALMLKMQIKLPEELSLKAGLYKLRVTEAKTKAFGIPLANPMEWPLRIP